MAMILAVYDARDESWWGLTEAEREGFKAWLREQTADYDGRAIYRTEIHHAEQPFARIFAFALDAEGRKYADPETGDVAEVPTRDVPISSMPPARVAALHGRA
jgi:hypothetical protein